MSRLIFIFRCLFHILLHRYNSRHNNIIHTRARKSDDLARRGAINGIPPPPQPLAIIITFLVNSASSPQTAMAAAAVAVQVKSF